MFDSQWRDFEKYDRNYEPFLRDETPEEKQFRCHVQEFEVWSPSHQFHSKEQVCGAGKRCPRTYTLLQADQLTGEGQN